MILNNEFEWSLDPKDSNYLKYVGGVDVSYGIDSDDAVVSLVVVKIPELTTVFELHRIIKFQLPYIPTFLAFREVEFLTQLIEELRLSHPDLVPQVIMVDGNGILHPREFGIACHLGVLSGIPTIGCSKTPFYLDGIDFKAVKKHVKETLTHGGEYVPLTGESGKCWGCALKSTDTVINPVFISVGHKIDLPTAIQVVNLCCKHRIPEPIRLADLGGRAVLHTINK